MGEQLCWSLFLNKVAGLGPATLSKKRLQHSCFPVNFFIDHFRETASSLNYYFVSSAKEIAFWEIFYSMLKEKISVQLP